mgnify:FL=1
MKNRCMRLVCFLLLIVSGSIRADNHEKKGKKQSSSIEGEVVDLSCFLSGGMRGEGHKSCAVGCLEKGTPAGIVDSAGNIFVIIAPSPGYANFAAQTIRLSGKITGNNISPTKMEAKKGKKWAEIPLDGGSPK